MYKQIEEYMNCICKAIPLPSKEANTKLKKIASSEITIPTTETIHLLSQYNYNREQLKMFVKHYRLKQSGNKNELFSRIYHYLVLSRYASSLQKVIRGHLWRVYERCHGPAYKNRDLCVNDTDFLTMDPVKEIPQNQFYSFKDADGFVYGFDMVSLFNLNKKIFYHKETRNPYNRKPIPADVILNMKKLIRMGKMLHMPVNIVIEDDSQPAAEKDTETRCRDLFHAIDGMGHYTTSDWFMSLDVRHMRKLIRELTEIWNYRANIPLQMRRQICPPHGDPFRELRYADLFISEQESTFDNQRQMVLRVLEKLVYSGTNDENKALGAYYVLGTLTLVNRNAASTMPWLYESFIYV